MAPQTFLAVRNSYSFLKINPKTRAESLLETSFPSRNAMDLIRNSIISSHKQQETSTEIRRLRGRGVESLSPYRVFSSISPAVFFRETSYLKPFAPAEPLRTLGLCHPFRRKGWKAIDMGASLILEPS